MWIAMLNPKPLENDPKNAKKQPTENQTNTKNEISLKVAVRFSHLDCQGGGIRPSAPSQLCHWL